jgi:hypothetical protein
MKKKLFKTLLFGLLLFIASKLFIAFTAYQVISELKEQYKNDVLLTYTWISSTLDGSISIEGIELTPYVMKKTFNIELATLHYADYYSLVTRLPSLKDGYIEKLESLSIPSIQADLKGKSFEQLPLFEKNQSWFSPFSLYGCGSFDQLSPEQYTRMGINEWESSLSVDIDQNAQGHDLLSITLDQKELGRINVVSEWPRLAVESFLKYQNLKDLKLIRLDITHQDGGFFRRLNILCNKDDVENRSVFSANSAMGWKNVMFSQGLLVSDSLVELYATYLMQGGILLVEANKNEGFLLTNLKELVNKDLIKFFDVKLKLNSQKLNNAELYVDGSIIFPPIKNEMLEKIPVVQEIKFVPGFKEIEIGFINQHINRKIRVKMLDDKVYEGLLSSVTEYNLGLTQYLPGGVVRYPLMLNEIQTFEVWVKHEQ